jgi:hypothetical protein
MDKTDEQGWVRKGAKAFVPVDQVKEYVRYAKTE